MQIEAHDTTCPACGAGALAFSPVLHHMVCAYVGPDYDFARDAVGYICPKCRRGIGDRDPACEIIGASALCAHCGREFVVSSPTIAA